MFQNAVRIVRPQVSPVVFARRRANSTATAYVAGAALILNPDGWFITADHVIDGAEKEAQQVADRAGKEIQGPADQVINFGWTIGFSGAGIEGYWRIPDEDLAIGKLADYAAPAGHLFPEFVTKDPEPGAVLCRVGFPFSGPISISWAPSGFVFAANQTEVPPFVNPAMVSRVVQGRPAWIETSGAGLPGHSGGPLVNAAGHVCGIDSQTRHLPRQLRDGGTHIMTVGRVVPAHAIRGHLDALGINYYVGGPVHV